MRIEKLHLQNFRGFKDCIINFPKDSNIAVFIGNNGSGKTSILEAIDMLLSEIYYHTKGLKRKYPQDDDINVNTQETRIAFDCEFWGRNTGKVDWGFYHSKKVNTRRRVQFREDTKESLNDLKRDNVINPSFLYFSAKYKQDNHSFFNWFKEKVNYENILKLENKDFNFELPLLKGIRKIIDKDLGLEIKVITKELDATTEIVFKKGNNLLKLSQLSDGEQRRIALIIEILQTIFENLPHKNEYFFKFPALVLIDEIELHLHPRWQRDILPNLASTFPEIQFIATTHSPQVLSGLEKESVFVLDNFQVYQGAYTKGRDSNAILLDLMGVAERPKMYQEKITQLDKLIEKEAFEEASDILKSLEKDFGKTDAEITRIRTTLELFDIEID